jgi:ABC-type dipeptide/oligopeptide/nickel transport system permease component
VPGIGSLLIDAILRNDTPVIMGVTVRLLRASSSSST